MTSQRLRRSCTPRVRPLEARRLLAASASYVGLGALDVAGPTAAVGPGGVKNLHVQVTIPLSGAATPTIDSLNIAGPTGFEWTYGTTGSGVGNPQANPVIAIAAGKVAADGASETFDAYFSPVVDAVDPTTGATVIRTLANDQPLALTVAYAYANNGPVTTDAAAGDPALVVTPTDLNQALADATPAVPSVAVGTFTGAYLSQTADGMGHVLLSGLPGGAQIVLGTAELSDVAGIDWDSGSSYGRDELGMTITQPAAGGTTADFAFPPRRDEAGSTMTARFQLAGSSQWYIVDVPIASTQHTDPNLRDGGPIDPNATPFVVSPTTTPDLVSYVDSQGVSHVADIQDVFDAGHPVVVLSAGTYQINKPLDIDAGMILRGADPSVELDFAGLPASIPSGIINLNASHITLDQFKIRFLDPQVNFTGPNPAIIVNQDGDQRARVDLNVLNLDIQAPATTAAVDPDNGLPLTVATTFFDTFNSGTIEGNTVYGGTIAVQGGPWTISNNRVLGAVAGTLNLGAFTARAAHDVTLADNTVSDTDPADHGLIDRFFASQGSGYDFALTGNVAGPNVGVAAAVPDGEPATTVNPRNNREDILFEDFGKIFEGNVAAIGVSSSTAASDDRRVISIPEAELAFFSGYLFAGRWAVTVLDGPLAGTHVDVIQAFPSSTDPSNADFLLDASLPAGSYDLDIAPAYSDVTITANSIDTAGTVSTALVLGTTMVDTTVTGNTFTGDRSTETDGNNNTYESQAIRFNPYKASLSTNYLHADGTDDSYNVLDVRVIGNTIIDAVGGIQADLEVDPSVTTTAGRTYGYLDLEDNQFLYSYRTAQILTVGNPGDYSQLVNNQGVVPDPTATNFADPSALRVTAAGNTVQWIDGAPPSPTDTVVNAATVNGTPDEANAPLTLLTDLTTYPLSESFDFGPSGQVVAAGSTSVSELTDYTAALGYGWVDDSGDRNSITRGGGDALTTDAVYASYMTFQVDLPDGVYDVTPIVGDLGPFAHSAAVTLQGVAEGTVTTFAGQIQEPTYQAIVVDGHLQLLLQGLHANGGDGYAVIEGLAIVTQPLVTDPAAGDPSFEAVPEGAGFAYDPAGSAWAFAGSSGVAGNESGLTGANPAAPDGQQVAFLQGTGSFSQSVSFATAGTYRISFGAAQRAAEGSYDRAPQDFQVVVDGHVVATVRPVDTSYQPVATASFALAAGPHTIAFVGLDSAGGDNTAFVDAVSIAPVLPAVPATVANDPSFEAVRVGTGFEYDPTGSAWTFAGTAGVSGNGSAFTQFNPPTPAGSQVAFLQQMGVISQVVTFTTSGTFQVSFLAARRDVLGGEDFQVWVDGNVVGTFAPNGTAYAPFSTGSFTVAAAGPHTIAFVGLDSAGGDHTVFLDAVSITPVTPAAPAPPAANDPGFEAVRVGTGFEYDPTGSAWTFAGTAGVTGNGSGFTYFNPAAPAGTQVGFLQQFGVISQAVTFATGGTFQINFLAAQRALYGSEDFQVWVDGTAVGTFTPGGTAYAPFSTGSFSVAAGAHVIAFVGLDSTGGDHTAFLDQVTITAAVASSGLGTPAASAAGVTKSAPVTPVPTSTVPTVGLATPRGPVTSSPASSGRARLAPPRQSLSPATDSAASTLATSA